MKRTFILLCILVGMTEVGVAQNKAIYLEKPKWRKIIEDALQAKKIIFVDCHTSWCGPCKLLARDVFTCDSVADYFNHQFVNVSYDIEKDKMPPFVNVPDVKSVPTLWFIDPESLQIVYGITGAPNAAKLMSIARMAQDSLWNFPGMKARLQQGEGNQELFFAYYNALKGLGWEAEYKKLGKAYLNKLKMEQFAEMRNWELFEDLSNDPLELLFRQVCEIQNTLKEKIGKDRVEQKINPNLLWGVQRIVDWEDPKDMPNDSTYLIMRDFIHSMEFQRKEWMVRLLDVDKYARRGDWYGMLTQLQHIVEYFGCTSNEAEWSMKKFFGKLLKNGNRPQLKRGVECIDLIIAEKGVNGNIDLMDLRKRLLTAIEVR